jgi:hypothetical protein
MILVFLKDLFFSKDKIAGHDPLLRQRDDHDVLIDLWLPTCLEGSGLGVYFDFEEGNNLIRPTEEELAIMRVSSLPTAPPRA